MIKIKQPLEFCHFGPLQHQWGDTWKLRPLPIGACAFPMAPQAWENSGVVLEITFLYENAHLNMTFRYFEIAFLHQTTEHIRQMRKPAHKMEFRWSLTHSKFMDTQPQSLCRKESTHERESDEIPQNNYFAGCPRATSRLRIGISTRKNCSEVSQLSSKNQFHVKKRYKTWQFRIL